MPARSNTGVFGDIDACISGTHYVHGKLVRNRTALPDVTQLPLDYLYYCPLDKYWRGAWPNASYHFDAANGTGGNTSSNASFEAWW